MLVDFINKFYHFLLTTTSKKFDLIDLSRKPLDKNFNSPNRWPSKDRLKQI